MAAKTRRRRAPRISRRIARKLSPRRIARRAARGASRRVKRKVATWWRGKRVKVKPPRRGAKTAAPRKQAAPRTSAAARTTKPKAAPAAAQRASSRAAQRSRRTGRTAKTQRGTARGTVPAAALSAYATTAAAQMDLGMFSARPNHRGIPSARRAERRGDCPWCRGLGHAPMLTPTLPCQPCGGTGRAHPGMARPTGRYRAVAFEAWQPDVELDHSNWYFEDPVAAQQAAARLIAGLVHRKRPASVLRWRIEHHA